MTKPKHFLSQLCFYAVAVSGAIGAVDAEAQAAVLASVVEVRGSATGAAGGTTKFVTLKAGDALAEGSLIRTGVDGRVLFSPVPGVAVSAGKDTSTLVTHLTVTKRGEAVQRREARFRLDVGMLTFSMEKRDAKTTRLSVETPHGAMEARGAIGAIGAVSPCVKVAALNGWIIFTPSGVTSTEFAIFTDPKDGSAFLSPDSLNSSRAGSIAIPPGSVLTICGEGDDVKTLLINTITRTSTSFRADGAQGDTRSATVQEMESTRGIFEGALTHAAMAVGCGLLSPEGAAEVTRVLTMINQSFAVVGLTPIEAPAIGRTTRQSGNFSADGALSPSGFSGGALNPANTSGEVISREQ